VQSRPARTTGGAKRKRADDSEFASHDFESFRACQMATPSAAIVRQAVSIFVADQEIGLEDCTCGIPLHFSRHQDMVVLCALSVTKDTTHAEMLPFLCLQRRGVDWSSSLADRR